MASKRKQTGWRSIGTILITASCLSSGSGAQPADAEQALSAMRIALLDLPVEKSARFSRMELVFDRAQALVEAAPGQPAPLAWRGVMAANLASVRSDLGSLGLAKDARRDIEAAAGIDAAALDSSIYSLLAYLYANVPGWPIGFGDDERADELYRQAISLNPDGAELHRDYATFLMQQDRHAEAIPQLAFALSAPLRVNASELAAGISCRMAGCSLYSDATDADFRAEVSAQLATAREEAR